MVARDLLGKRLVRRLGVGCLSGLIVETEAYCDTDEPDLACHGVSNKGQPTPRTAVMFGPAGHAFVYFTYGMHWLLNVVTGQPDQANAVLLRAIEPTEGDDIIARHRPGRPRTQWTNGPAKLTQALAVNDAMNGADLTAPATALWIEEEQPLSTALITVGPRVGLGKTPEPWLSKPWRYWIRDNPFVSQHR